MASPVPKTREERRYEGRLRDSDFEMAAKSAGEIYQGWRQSSDILLCKEYLCRPSSDIGTIL
jgi:hypothetical protein